MTNALRLFCARLGCIGCLSLSVIVAQRGGTKEAWVVMTLIVVSAAFWTLDYFEQHDAATRGA